LQQTDAADDRRISALTVRLGADLGAGLGMVQRVATVAFEGIEVRPVDVQVQVAPGMPAFAIVGLPDKAVSEARERVRSALIASGVALPARRITINLAPADLPKEGSHYGLPIALGLMAAIGAIPHDALSGFTVLGELGLDGSIAPVAGVLPAAIGANARGEGLICPARCGPEAAWASPEIEIVAAGSLIQLANHFKGTQVLSRPQPKILETTEPALDLADIKGQESAKRALEVAAAGGHNLLMVGPPGAGKSMLAARLPSILPPLAPAELLEVSMVASIAGQIEGGALTSRRPFRAPHHSASMPRPWSAVACMRDLTCSSRRCCFLTSCRNFSRRCWARCASRWKAARCRSRAPITASPIRRASCWWRR
jgi:magnesium chelatase family protein